MLNGAFFILFFIGLTNTEGKAHRLNVTRLKRDEVCRTEGCLKAAGIIKKSLNVHADPCDDFYEFACGGYISRVQLPNNTLGINSFSEIKETTLHQVQEILSEDVHENDIEPVRVAKQFFKDCMDEETILHYGLNPIMHKVRELGGWPVAEAAWEPDTFSWTDTTRKAREMGFTSNYILSFDIETNLLNSSSRTIYVGPPNLGIPVFNLRSGINDPRVQVYFKLMVGLAVKLGVSIKRALIHLATMLLFEIQLAQSFPTTSDRREDINKTYVSMTVSEAQQRFPSIEWKEFLRSKLSSLVSLSKSATIVVAFPEYLDKLQDLLHSVSKRTLANYLIWRMMFYSLNSYLIISDVPRWKSCVGLVSDKLDLVVGSMYVKKFIKKETKQSIVDISSNIRNRMYETLSKCTWIDKKTRKNALNKIEAMTQNVAYHDILLDDNKLVKIYDGLHLKPGQYYESLLSIQRFTIDFIISTLHLPVQKDGWLAYENPLTVNAFYSLQENSMKVPVALLQKNIFEPDRPNYLNYGAVGFIVGHELSHAFDDQGSAFDENGNYRDWWSPETKKKYLNKVQCFVDQYNTYKLAGIEKNVSGLVTQGENIADNEGIKEAYYAYKKWVEKHGREPKLPGLHYSSEQLFWIGAANVWCSKYQPVYLEYALSEDLHAPDKIRVIGAISNQEMFAKDFGCAVGSRMNPEKKCSLWT